MPVLGKYQIFLRFLQKKDDIFRGLCYDSKVMDFDLHCILEVHVLCLQNIMWKGRK